MKPNKIKWGKSYFIMASTYNTQNKRIDWASITRSNEDKLKRIKKLTKEYESLLPDNYYMIMMNIINDCSKL